MHYSRVKEALVDTLNPLPDHDHLPDPPAPGGHSRHPALASTWVMLAVIAVCLVLMLVSLL